MEQFGDAINFGGGLGNSDWFVFGTGLVGSSTASAMFNQAAYIANVQMRQQQIYQDKNYHLSWVTTARDDIRGVMEASSARLANYVLVATMILQTAIGMILSNDFGSDVSYFFMMYWLDLALAIMFFTTSVVFAVKGQNQAFLNTMRLLTWEIRPENPASYEYDYMQQIQRFERLGLQQLFRLPGLEARHTRAEEPDAQPYRRESTEKLLGTTGTDLPKPLSPYAGADVDGDDDERRKAVQGDFEVLEPMTRQLLYLARFGHFMQLWQAYDSYSRYCIGFGLISMTRAAAFWSIGTLSSVNRNITDFLAWVMMLIFLYTALVVYHQSFHTRHKIAQCALYALYMIGPLLSAIAVNQASPTWMDRVLVPLSVLSNFWFWMMSWWFSFKAVKKPAHEAGKFITGPAGQQFSAKWTASDDERQSDADSRSSSPSSDGSMSEGQNESDGGPSPTEDHNGLPSDYEKRSVSQTHRSVARIFRCELLIATIFALICFVAALLDQFGSVALWFQGISTDYLLVHEVPMSWPSRNVRPSAIACDDGQVFAANAYQIFRVDVATGTAHLYPCPVDRIIVDVALRCDGRGACRPLALLNDSTLFDCDVGQEPRLWQTSGRVQRMSFMDANLDEPIENRSAPDEAMMLIDGSLVLYKWRPSRNGWAPLYQMGAISDKGPIEGGCNADAAGTGGCPTASRRLATKRPMRGTAAARDRVRRGSIVQRSTRMSPSTYAEGAQERTLDVDSYIQDLDMTPGGLFVFRWERAKRGFTHMNVVQLVEVPSMQLLAAWHLPDEHKQLVSGCAVDEGTVLLIQGDNPAKLLRASVVPKS